MKRVAIYGIRVNPRVGMEALVGSKSLGRIEEYAGAGPVEAWARLGNVWTADEIPVMTGPSARHAMTRACRDAHEARATHLVLLGAWARPILDLACFEWGRVRMSSYPHLEVAWSPHPSGLSRWWNREANRAMAQDFWIDTAHEAEDPRIWER